MLQKWNVENLPKAFIILDPTKKTQKHPHLWRPYQRTPNPKWKKKFYNLNQKTCWIRRWFEQLSSSIGWRVIALQTFAKIVAHAGLKGYFPCQILMLVSTIYVPALALKSLTPISLTWAVVSTSALCIIYTTLVSVYIRKK